MVLDPRHQGKRRASMEHRKGVTTSGDSSSSRTSQLLTHASETLLTMWGEKNNAILAE